MYSIADLSTETRISVEEIRMILMDVRPDWESCITVTEAEYALIKQSAQAALPEGRDTAITPVNPEAMPLEQQEKLVNNAGQVLGFPLAIAVMQEIKMVEALQTAKNHALLNVIKTKRDEFNQELNALATADQQAFIATIQEIADGMVAPVSGTVEKMQKGAESANTQIENLLKGMTAQSMGKAL